MKGGDEGVVGNIEKRGENSYRLRVSGGYTGEGKRIIYKKTVQAKNKNEARKELALFISEIETGQALSAKKMRFRDYADFWIPFMSICLYSSSRRTIIKTWRYLYGLYDVERSE